MAKQVLKILLVFIPALFYVRCAQVATLSGGKRDVTPPKPVAAHPTNHSNRFNSELIVLQFDEYVKLNDLPNQLVISPRLKTMPDIETDRKTIRIQLKKEELSPNTTYRFSFGKAVVDMNEGNVLPDFEYVFSTGEVIDSLTITGQVTDAFTNAPAANVLVGLYTAGNATDSLAYKEMPDYTGKTNEGGTFYFRHLPYRSFKVLAIDDKNKNNLYDGETEKIAFLDSDLSLKSDTSVSFRLFQEESSKNFIKKTVLPYAGLAQIILNKKTLTTVAPLHARDSAGIFETRAGIEKDTIAIYYKSIMDTLDLVLRSDVKTDTLKIALPKKAGAKRKFRNYTTNTPGNILALNTPLVITFLNWMDLLKTSLPDLHLSSPEDSLAALNTVTGRWLDVSRFEITSPLKQGVNYTLKVDTCAFFDMNGICSDSTRMSFKTESKLEYGKVTLKLLLNKKQPYSIQLLNDKNDVVREAFVSFSLSASNAVSLEFADLRPGTYLVKVIFDDNGNHKWDSGNLLLNRQPERVIINSKQIKVLSDWEIEEEIQIRE